MNTAYRVVFPNPGQVSVNTISLPWLEPADVLIDTVFSLISNGTERVALDGEFSGDEHWGRYITYPFVPGYACTGYIARVGSDIPSSFIGNPVLIRRPHQSKHIVPFSSCTILKPGTRLDYAAWIPLARLGYLALLSSNVSHDERVAVVGGGPVGQLTLRWLRYGAFSNRLMIAKHLVQAEAAKLAGAEVLKYSTSAYPLIGEVQKALGGPLEIAIDCTPDANTLAWALGAVADEGRIVLVGHPPNSNMRNLTAELQLKALSIIGVHDRNRIGTHSRAEFAHFFCSEVESGRFSITELEDRVFPAALASEAYELIRRRSGTLGVYLQW